MGEPVGAAAVELADDGAVDSAGGDELALPFPPPLLLQAASAAAAATTSAAIRIRLPRAILVLLGQSGE